MSLADLTPETVRQALAECDQMGREAFLSTYGFGKASGYFLIHNGQAYDSKAIAGVAVLK
jgi:5-methylcytosine-specific restriction enzyme A